MTRALNIHRGGGLGRPRAQLLDTSSTRDGAYVRNAPTVVTFFSTSSGGYDCEGPLHSSPNGTFDQPRKIAWRGGNATGLQVRSMVGEVDVTASSIEMHFIWTSSCVEGEAQSGGNVIPNENRDRKSVV